jgi:hypothetical protein
VGRLARCSAGKHVHKHGEIWTQHADELEATAFFDSGRTFKFMQTMLDSVASVRLESGILWTECVYHRFGVVIMSFQSWCEQCGSNFEPNRICPKAVL